MFIICDFKGYEWLVAILTQITLVVNDSNPVTIRISLVLSVVNTNHESIEDEFVLLRNCTILKMVSRPLVYNPPSPKKNKLKSPVHIRCIKITEML